MASADAAVAGTRQETAGRQRRGPRRRPRREVELFANRIKVYSRSVAGFWRRVKWWVVAVLLGLLHRAVDPLGPRAGERRIRRC
ncbi:MAG: hypothetical protein U1E33_08515 [Rhodospirillales bacterium]